MVVAVATEPMPSPSGSAHWRVVLLIGFSCADLGRSKCLSGDCQDGPGVFKDIDGAQYDGQWSGGKWHGQGAETSPYGFGFVGAYQQGIREGKGTLTFTDGSYKYEGEWSKGKM
jgi:hypothetical protein